MFKICRLLTLFFLLAAAVPVVAQERIAVSGRVTDPAGQPIAGAFIAEKGTTNGAIADAEGRFSVRADMASTLEVSFLGYVTREVPVSQVANLVAIVLQQDATQIGEVVVIGYGTVRKDDLTGSVSTVRASELNRGALTSTQGLLQGKVPGLHILPGDGGPGSGSTIRIRGQASLSAMADPLIVIDGMPVSNAGNATPGLSNALSTINPADIESFSILKDASAAAIYGSRASNGVIMITTKKGSGKAMQISYNSSYSVSTNSKRVDMMTPAEYRDYITTLYPEGTDNGNIVRNLMGKANTDWQKEIFRPALATDQNLGLYGNYKSRMPYRVSFGYTDENGTIKTSNYKRGTIDMSLSPSFFKDHLKVIVNAKESYTANNFADGGGAVNQAAFFDPTQDIHFRNADGSVDNSITNGWFNWFSGAMPNNNATRNPFSTLYDHFNNNKVNRLTGNVQLDYKLHFLPELRFNLNLGLDMTHSKGQDGDRPGSVQSALNSFAPNLGQTNHRKERHRSEMLEFYTAYDKYFGNHHFDAMLGYSWQYYYTDNDNYTTNNDANNTLFEDYPLWLTDSQLVSFFGRVNYGFDGRYLLTVSMRADGSSRFAPDKRWAYSPAAAFAWNIKNEGFLKGNNSISELKLRVGYGSTPQQDISQGDYLFMQRYNQSVNPTSAYIIDGKFQQVLKPAVFNSLLTWETVETWNVGLDYGILKGNLFGSLEFYHRTTKDLINDVFVPRGSNFSNRVVTNVGNMVNKGVELALNANIINRGDLTWTVGSNITYQHTEITKLVSNDDPDYKIEHGGIGGTGNLVQVHKVGYAPSTFWLFQQVWGSDGKPVQNVFVDQNGDGLITDADHYITGKKPTPDVYFGLNMRVAYKDWDFGFNSHGSFGNWVFNRFYSDNATPTGDYFTQGLLVNIANTVKRSGFTDKNANGQLSSDMFLENASFFRMDDITLGYTFRNLFRLRGNSSNLRLAFTAQNPFVITGYSGLDPENGGIDNNIWPLPRIYSLKVALNF
jgi:iron complex outermembrane receptor protein